MQLSILRKFAAIARFGSFTRAAQELHIAQPALSKQIQRLENELETSLFDRTGRTIVLTKAGRTLLQHSQQILEEWGKAQKSIQEMTQIDRGLCRVAVFPTFIMFMAPNFLIDFTRAYHLIDLEIEQSINEFPNETLIQWVLGHHFDAGIVVLPVGHPRLTELPLYTEESVLIVGRDHPLYGREVIRTSELGHQPLIVTTLNVTYRKFLSSAFENVDAQLQVKHVVHHYPIVFQMARAGIGAGIAPMVALEHLAKNDKSLWAIHIDPPLQRQLGWIELRGVIRSPAIEAFYQFLTNYIKEQRAANSLVRSDF